MTEEQAKDMIEAIKGVGVTIAISIGIGNGILIGILMKMSDL
jgi:hypothetical protein